MFSRNSVRDIISNPWILNRRCRVDTSDGMDEAEDDKTLHPGNEMVDA
jgi:hypothetical protein